jgi:hypothetical protein
MLQIGDIVKFKGAPQMVGYVTTINVNTVWVRWFQNDDNHSTPYSISSLEKYVSNW